MPLVRRRCTECKCMRRLRIGKIEEWTKYERDSKLQKIATDFAFKSSKIVVIREASQLEGCSTGEKSKKRKLWSRSSGSIYPFQQ